LVLVVGDAGARIKKNKYATAWQPDVGDVVPVRDRRRRGRPNAWSSGQKKARREAGLKFSNLEF
jgi:hypothetical protein